MNTRYFIDWYEGLPIDGYHQWIGRMLESSNIGVFRAIDFFYTSTPPLNIYSRGGGTGRGHAHAPRVSTLNFRTGINADVQYVKCALHRCDSFAARE